MKHKTDFEYKGYRTVRQWALVGFLPNKNAKGTWLWANPHHQNSFVYFSPKEVHRAEKSEIDAFFEPERRRNNNNRKKLKEQRLKEEICVKKELKSNLNLYRSMNLDAKEALKDICSQNREIKGTKRVVIDVETTGLSCLHDELLQVAIIDIDGNELYNGYFNVFSNSWSDAEMINGITKEFVKDKPLFKEERIKINKIMEDVCEIIGYNVKFDIDFLRANGIVIPCNMETTDIMQDFAYIYGERNEYTGMYVYKKLEFCANYYDYDWNSTKKHDALGDCLATLYCYNHIKEDEDRKGDKSDT
ncbi:MAG: 3'-5' exonuclease [Lachnospiraceae bacterium]|nr:3'-5' exonuclease [Lachnospiraceae bacterium]